MPLSRRKDAIQESSFAASICAIKNSLPVQEVLISGGDNRLRLGDDKRNSYGCTAFPQPEVLDFGSSTASSISASALAHAQESLARMTVQIATIGIPRAFESGVERIR